MRAFSWTKHGKLQSTVGDFQHAAKQSVEESVMGILENVDPGGRVQLCSKFLGLFAMKKSWLQAVGLWLQSSIFWMCPLCRVRGHGAPGLLHDRGALFLVSLGGWDEVMRPEGDGIQLFMKYGMSPFVH